MAQVNSENSTAMPAVSTRRHFLSQAAGVAAGGTILALAAFPPVPTTAAPAGALDPVFGLIEAHRTAQAAHLVALAEQNRLEQIGDPAAYLISDAEAAAQIDALNDLLETAPTTLAGLQAWAAYLGGIMNVGDWMFEAGPTLVATLDEAPGNIEASGTDETQRPHGL